MTKRTHITTKAIVEVRPESKEQETSYKPHGFWYGIDGDWERWCRGENWGLAAESLEYEVVLADENILALSSVVEIDGFHEKYRSGLPGWIKNYIDWARVAEDFDGIEIAPYQWARRFEGPGTQWYYSWDCASGCIWRPKGVTVKLSGKVVVESDLT